jgi:histidinol dehydrogenase
MRILESRNKGFERELEAILAQRREAMVGIEETVREIIERVRTKGDEALILYANQFDGVEISPKEMEVPQKEWAQAAKGMEREALASLKRAAERIESFHRHQLARSWFDTEQGIVRGQMVRPLTRAGVYVPGWKAVYPSSGPRPSPPWPMGQRPCRRPI